MEIKQIIKLYADETLSVFKIFVGKYNKRTLFDAVFYKIALLLRLKKHEPVYVNKVLSHLQKELITINNLLDNKINDIQTACASNEIRFLLKKKIEIGLSHPITYSLIETFKNFDKLFCLLHLSEKRTASNKNKYYFQERHQYKTKLLHLFTEIMQIKTRHFHQSNKQKANNSNEKKKGGRDVSSKHFNSLRHEQPLNSRDESF